MYQHDFATPLDIDMIIMISSGDAGFNVYLSWISEYPTVIMVVTEKYQDSKKSTRSRWEITAAGIKVINE